MHAAFVAIALTAGAVGHDFGTGELVVGGTNAGYAAAYSDGSLHGIMPQNCYSPRYGCYPGNSRYMHRYPAFHGWHFRQPYNYRQVFDYPWHAALHEPTSLFAHGVEEQQVQPPVTYAR